MYLLKDINESYTEIETDDIEFKKRVINNLSIFEEGYKYNHLFRAGIWDGKKHFYTIEKNHNIRFPKGLTPYIERDLKKLNHEYTYKTTFKPYNITKNELEKFIITLELPFKPYEFQVEAVLQMISQKRLTLKSATGSGKSLMAYIFFMYMLSIKKRCILVVPSINLVEQMYTDFESYGLKNASELIKQIGGEHKNKKDLSEKPVVISTWQSLFRMKSKEFEIFDVILVDECHTAKGDALNNIIRYSTKAQWKLGMTGTIPRDKVSRLQLVSALGKIHSVITPGGLIKLGLATPITINALYLNYTNHDRDEFNKSKPDYEEEWKFVENHHYRNKKVTNIISKLSTKGNVLGLFSHIAHGEKLLKNCIETRTGESNVLLLHKITPKPIKEAFQLWETDKDVIFYMNAPIEEADREKILKNTKKITDEKTAKLFNKSIKSLDDINIFFVAGKVSGTDREYIRKNLESIHIDKISFKFNEKIINILKNEYIDMYDGSRKIADEVIESDVFSDKWMNARNVSGSFKIINKYNAIIIGNYSVVSTGVNYKNLHFIVYASSLKSHTKIVQSIGRGMRLHESKQMFHIYDCVDILTSTGITEKPNYILKHFYERLEYYREDEYEINEKEIKLEGDTRQYEIETSFDEW